MPHDRDNWTMIVGEADGEKRMYRIRHGIPDGVDRGNFSECIIIEWRFADEGWPDSRTSALHKAFEQQLGSLDNPSANSLLVHVYTGGGIKEWCYYAKNYDRYMEELNAALKGKPRFPIEIMHDMDATWKYWTGIKEFATSSATA